MWFPCLPLALVAMLLPWTSQAVTSCIKKDVCSCQSDEGLINLRPLDSASGPKFPNIVDPIGGYYSYAYNPCTPFTLGQCTNVAVCQRDTITGLFPVGTHASAQFVVEAGLLYVTYQASDSYIPPNIRKAKIQLICDKNQDGIIAFVREDTTTSTYSFTLTSKHACPTSGGGGGGGGGLSTGSVLCIIFAVLVAVYLVAGVLYMTYRRGATGVERIPNVDFWKELPALVKDGVMFTVRGGKTSSGYNEI